MAHFTFFLPYAYGTKRIYASFRNSKVFIKHYVASKKASQYSQIMSKAQSITVELFFYAVYKEHLGLSALSGCLPPLHMFHCSLDF